MARFRLDRADRIRFNKCFQKKHANKCWPWGTRESGSLNGQGYGHFPVGLKVYRAHRVAYMLVHGRISSSTWVFHTCANRHCVNPRHLTTDRPTDKKPYRRPPKPVRSGRERADAFERLLQYRNEARRHRPT